VGEFDVPIVAAKSMRIEAKMAPPSPAERQAMLTDIGRRLDHLPIGPMHRRVVVAIGLGLFLEMYEITRTSQPSPEQDSARPRRRAAAACATLRHPRRRRATPHPRADIGRDRTVARGVPRNGPDAEGSFGSPPSSRRCRPTS